MKVCFVSHSAFKGGAERTLIETIDALVPHGIKSYVILPYRGPLCCELIQRRITFSILNSKTWTGYKSTSLTERAKNAVITLAMSLPAAWKINAWGCDVVYTNTSTIWIGAIAAALTHKPHIWHIHEFGKEDHGIVFLYGEKLSLKFINHFSSKCIAISTAVAHKYKNNISKEKLQIVYQSVTLTDINTENVKSNRFRCVIVGKVSPGKRQEDAIRAIINLHKSGMKVELYVIGDSCGYEIYWNKLIRIIRLNNAENYIHLVGYHENPFNYMQSADAILMCSICEAFGRVTIEGMLAGKPIIGARSGATIELVKDGFNGFLYTPKDQHDLAKKIYNIYNNPELAKKLGNNGRRWAKENFSQKLYGQKIYAILKSLKKNKEY